MAWPLPFQTSRERPVTVNDINGPGPSPGRISTVSSSQKKNSFGFRNISWNHFLGFPEMGETRWMVDLVDFMDNTIYKSINERWLGVALWLRKPPFWDIVGTLPGGWFGRGLGYPGISWDMIFTYLGFPDMIHMYCITYPTENHWKFIDHPWGTSGLPGLWNIGWEFPIYG